MKAVFSESFREQKNEILRFIEDFEILGERIGEGDRNQIKVFESFENQINIKAFKPPNFINKLVYKSFRKSKAERSFNYANFLLSRGIGTPQPIAFIEEVSAVSLIRSFYVSEHLKTDLTFRDLIFQPHSEEKEEIIRAFTRFTFDLHEKEIEFLDHSPGNTLIQLNNGDYQFFLVDLNRMNFRSLSFEERMKNFSRLTSKKEIVAIMAGEYARLYPKSEEETFEKMWFYTQEFQKHFWRKRKLKKKLKFWKK